MAVSESNMAEFKMAAIIKLSQNQWVKFFRSNGRNQVNEWSFFVQMVGTNLGKCEWVWEEKLRWLNPRWWNCNMAAIIKLFKMAAIINLFQSENWMSLSQIELVWIRVSESKMAKWWLNHQEGMNSNGWIQRWLPSSSWVRMNEFESDWISLSQSQNGVRVFLSESERR